MSVFSSKKEQKVASELRTFRKNASLTQDDLARSLGVTRQTVISIEKGTYLPSLGLALKIAQHFNVAVEQMFSLEDVK